MNKDMLIDLYRILDAIRKGRAPDMQHVAEGLVALRDELLRPDTEDIVEHIRGALQQQQAAADVLTQGLIGSSRRRPLPIRRLHELMASVAADAHAGDDLAVAFGRLVEEAHDIRP